jgi:hypothetical protein
MSKDASRSYFAPGNRHGCVFAGYFSGDCSSTVNLIITKKGDQMATRKQSMVARKNIRKASVAAKRKQTLKHLPKKTRTALGKEGAKAAKRLKRKH